MHVRRLASGDGALVAAYLAVRGLDGTLAAIEWEARVNDATGWLTVVAVVGERSDARLVGNALVTTEAGEGLVHDLFVEDGSRRQGIAAKMLARVVEEAARAGLRELVADVSQERGVAWRAFLAAGFAERQDRSSLRPQLVRLGRMV